MSDLIEPAHKGQALLDDIESALPQAGQIAVWWLGQSGYLIKSRHGSLLIDPYLSEHLTTKYAATNRPHVRMTECPIRSHELHGIDLVLCSHKHSDHLDPGTIPGLIAASPDMRIVVPEAILDHATSIGLPSSFLGINIGECEEKSGFMVTAIPSAHEGLDTDDAGRHLYLGFVIEVEGLRLYHSGDSLVYEGLAERWLGDRPYDILFLPINDRDPGRGVPGNMSAAEAVDLATLVKPRFVVPHHYDMFTFNTVPVSVFESEAARLPEGVVPKVLKCGERWEVRAWA